MADHDAILANTSFDVQGFTKAKSEGIDPPKNEVTIHLMGLPAEKIRHTIDEYFAFELAATDRHEFHDGEILAMSGGTVRHSIICLNIGGEIRNALKGKPCQTAQKQLARPSGALEPISIS